MIVDNGDNVVTIRVSGQPSVSVDWFPVVFRE